MKHSKRMKATIILIFAFFACMANSNEDSYQCAQEKEVKENDLVILSSSPQKDSLSTFVSIESFGEVINW